MTKTQHAGWSVLRKRPEKGGGRSGHTKGVGKAISERQTYSQHSPNWHGGVGEAVMPNITFPSSTTIYVFPSTAIDLLPYKGTISLAETGEQLALRTLALSYHKHDKICSLFIPKCASCASLQMSQKLKNLREYKSLHVIPYKQ